MYMYNCIRTNMWLAAWLTCDGAACGCVHAHLGTVQEGTGYLRQDEIGCRTVVVLGTKRMYWTPTSQLRLCEVSGVIPRTLQSCSVEQAVDLGCNTCRATD